MITFPDYDYGWTGGTDAAEAEAEAEAAKSAGSIAPAPQFTLGVLISDIGSGVVETGGKVTGAIGGVIDSVKSSVRNTYLYLIGGIALIGIIAIVLMGASARVMNKIEGK